jgi:hypothetical protein
MSMSNTATGTRFASSALVIESGYLRTLAKTAASFSCE